MSSCHMRLRSSQRVATAAITTVATAAGRSVSPHHRSGLSPVYSWSPCRRAAAVFAVANGVGLAVSVASGGSHLHLDLIGSGAFVAAVYTTRGAPQHLRPRLSALLAGIWGARLAGFLFYRVVNSESQHDARLEDTAAEHFWAISWLWGVVCSLPHTVGAGAANPPALGALGLGAAAFVAAGIAIETVADWQKHGFKANPDNAGKFCSVGLWTVVQQPNYLGDLMVWSGLLLLNMPSLLVGGSGSAGGAARAMLRLSVAALSPVFMYALFYGQASGAFTNSASLRDAKYGSDPDYKHYVASTPLIIPFWGPPGQQQP